MAQPHWSLNSDRTKLTVDFPTEPPTRFELDADEMDDFIAHLAEMRAAMTPAVPFSDPDPGSRMSVAASGRWYVHPRGAEGAAILLLHPGYRWVGIALEPEPIRELIQVLLRCLPLNAQSPQSTSNPPK
ncbi:MAG: hypothetical protein NDI90_00220 [Nitrospira sp. BO4]|jgi:hypothetical protein|nr:hypothetical protein [Nitrospira sp. BO4]